jgi:hypothetical protein
MFDVRIQWEIILCYVLILHTFFCFVEVMVVVVVEVKLIFWIKVVMVRLTLTSPGTREIFGVSCQPDYIDSPA